MKLKRLRDGCSLRSRCPPYRISARSSPSGHEKNETTQCYYRRRNRQANKSHTKTKVARLLAMEIDYGPFIREVPLPAEVEILQAHAEQRNGLLWISLPLKQK